MKSRFSFFFVLLIFSLFSLCGLSFMSCGDDDDDDDTTMDYFPNADGSSWIFTITDHEDNTTAERTSTIDGTKTFNQVNCQIMKDRLSDEPGTEYYTYAVDTGSELMVYGYELYENGSLTTTLVLPVPFKNLVYPMTVGQTWQVVAMTDVKLSDFELGEENDDLDGDGIDDTMDVTITATVREQANVSVPAGSFDSFKIESRVVATIHLSSVGDVPMSGVVTNLWFAPGVNVVKELNYNFQQATLTETAELKSYSLGS
ncbi:hypothetical protein ACFL27_14040 [candidate division CSSED10-310 bacterium]|uniref:DUF3108 domain-containing protein n=1 Tax=candidate division CSSED10-310 bacterium TaxID=2855610 RepID=A0ABV6YYP4_UNCC1